MVSEGKRIDALLTLPPDKHELREGELVLYVAFQKQIQVEQQNGNTATVIPRTFEDAFVYRNRAVIPAGIEPITKKINALVATYKDGPERLADELFELLKSAEKAGFALDILMYDPPERVLPPHYIADGLDWLDRELKGAVLRPSRQPWRRHLKIK